MKDPLRFINPLHEDIKAYAVSYFMSRKELITAEELRGFSAALMGSIAGSCKRHGAQVIGHIKAYIEHDKGFLHANTVGEPNDITVNGRDGGPVARFKLVVNSIIYGLEGEKVKTATEEAIGETASSFGLNKELDSQAVTSSPFEKGADHES